MNGYDLSRNWFDFCFDNPEKIKPAHTALYFFTIEHCNRLGWKEKFGLPMEMAKDAIGISNYKTYSKTFDDLVEWGFIHVIQQSKNQYSSTIVALVKNTKATTKALSKAMQKHSQKQQQKQVHGIVCIDKPITLEPITNKPENAPDKKIIPITRHADEEQEEKEKNVAAKKESLAILQMAGAPCLDPLYEITWIELCDQPNFLTKRRQQLERLAMDLQEYDEGYAIELMKKAIRDDSKAVIWPNTKSDYQNHLKKLNHGTIKKFNNADTQAARKQGLADLEDLADRILAGAKS